jgi:hypothetical protein
MGLSSVVALSFLALFSAQSAEPIESLIKKLGSRSFKLREAASKELLQRPEAAAALKKKLHSADVEVAKRAALILEHFDREPLRRLQQAVKQGEVDRIVKALAVWPEGKHEAGAWDAVRDLARAVLDRHKKNGGAHVDLSLLGGGEFSVLRTFAERRQDAQRNLGKPGYRFGWVFFRTTDAAVADPLIDHSVIVASGPITVRSNADPYQDFLVLAGGSVEIGSASNVLIISGGDVTIGRGAALLNSIIIARGKVTCSADFVRQSRIVSGKSVVYDKSTATDCKITENEANPLGFIRFVAPTGNGAALERAPDRKPE